MLAWRQIFNYTCK